MRKFAVAILFKCCFAKQFLHVLFWNYSFCNDTSTKYSFLANLGLLRLLFVKANACFQKEIPFFFFRLLKQTSSSNFGSVKGPFTSLHSRKFCALFFICWFYSKLTFSKKKSFSNTIRLSNSLESDHAAWSRSKLFAKVISRQHFTEKI